jgi:hypothetical protein
MAFVSQSNASGALVNDIKDYVVNTEVQVLSDEVLEASDRATSSESHSDNDTEHSGRSEEAAGQFAERNVNVKGDNDAVRLSPSAENEANVLTAIKVLQVVATYGAHGDTVWHGLAGYIPLVMEQIRAAGPIQLMFSGFGFKSPVAHGKVLGSIPDLGEKLALAHLDGLCSNIAAVYEKGAEVHILSDGLVYNGSSVPGSPTWALLIFPRLARCLGRSRVAVWKQTRGDGKVERPLQHSILAPRRCTGSRGRYLDKRVHHGALSLPSTRAAVSICRCFLELWLRWWRRRCSRLYFSNAFAQ